MPEATAEVLEEDGWLHTGDLGFMDNEGWIYLTGRKKNIIVTKTGENVYVEEIEEYINQSPYIEDSMVFPYDNNGEEIVGVQILPNMEYVRTKLGYEPDREELKDFVRTTTRKIKRHENPVPED